MTNLLKIPKLELTALLIKRLLRMAKSMHSINLLPGKGDTMLIQFLNWALTIGRLLIILVETLALGTFLYRFTLDMQISDMKDSIKIQRSIVSGYKTQEDNFKNLQARLAQIKNIDKETEKSPRVLNEILDMGKGYITFRNLYISSSLVRIEAAAPSAAPLTVFVNALKKYPNIKSISIDKVENKASSAEIIVGISAFFKHDGQNTDENTDLSNEAPFSEVKQVP